MKKIVTGIVAVTLIMLAVTSCKKTTAVNGGSWTFKDSTNAAINYTVTSGIADVSLNPAAYGVTSIAQLTTAAQTSSSYGSIVFTFFAYPKASGTYTITANSLPDSGSNQIALNMILASGSSYAQKNFNPTPFSAGTATANVTVMSNGYVKIAIPSLEMVNFSNASDSGLLTTSVQQTAPPE
jgi:hypothetical protein